MVRKSAFDVRQREWGPRGEVPRETEVLFGIQSSELCRVVLLTVELETSIERAS